MTSFQKTIGYFVFAIQVLLVFLLVFEDSIEVPAWLQAFGRMHPLLLHLPIGLLPLTVLLLFTRRFFESPSFNDLITFLLYLTSLTASLSALMGLLLSLEGGYEKDDLNLHKWLGIALSFFCWLLISLRDQKVLRPVLVGGMVLLIFTGHFGANITHGENFVLGPLQKENTDRPLLTDSSTVFVAAIEPVLEAKCFSCHNESKSKGNLVLTSMASIAKGGKNGPLWKPGDPDHSLLIERLLLPAEHKKHMPPIDKAQLTQDEIAFISQWVASGADVRQTLRELDDTDTLKRLSAAIISRYYSSKEQPRYHFEFVAQNKIAELSTPYRSVFQIAQNEPALQAEFYLAGSYEKKYLEELKSVKDQLVLLDLSKMPVTDEDLKTVAEFKNLEKLILNSTLVEGEGLKHLVKLEHLNLLSLSGAKIKTEPLKILGENKNLREVYLWNTGVSSADVGSLTKEFGHIRWDIGYQPDKSEVLQLNVPMLRNDGQVLDSEEKIVLKHNLPGAIIRYTTNDEDPDSINSPVYKEPIPAESYTVLKTQAHREGWLSSSIASYNFFKKGVRPSRAELLTKPDVQYPGEGVSTLFDEKKGMLDAYREKTWIAFRNEPLEAIFFFEGNTPSIRNITLSYAKHPDAWCLPPGELEVWGGSSASDLKLLNKVSKKLPPVLTGRDIEGATITIPESAFACYKIVVKPASKLPGKKDKPWLMVDEIFFN